MKYEIKLFASIEWNADMDTHVLGPAVETITEIDAEGPSYARAAADATVTATCSEMQTSTRWVKGKKTSVTGPTYRPCNDAPGVLMAWMTARGPMALVIAQ